MNEEQLLDELWGAATSLSFLELFGVLTGLAYLILAARQNILCWPFAIASVLAYIYICFKARLYAETFLQFYYLATGIYGWYFWSRNKGQGKHTPITTFSLTTHAFIILGGSAAFFITGYLISKYTNAAMPYVDAFTTVFSIITTLMVTWKKLENWIYWFFIDAVAVYLYASQGLYLTALLFIIYLVIVVIGYFNWRQDMAEQVQQA